ncbi:MAG TPA: response regulator transcription factor [Actinomycetes bacterium]|nr:response regulator transcription factor [Actinomycetes bacterium]
MRIVIAEDSVVLREGLTRLLADAGHEIVAAMPDATGLVETVGDLAPEIAVVDVRMPPTHTDEGLRAAVQIRRQYPEIAVLVFSQYVEERYASELLAGSTKKIGYLLKDRVADVRDFLDAVDRVADGGTVLDPEVVTQIFSRSKRREALDALTPREREVLEAMAEGYSNAAIASRLVVSEGAVEKHVSNIFVKLGLAPSEGGHRRVRAVLTYLGV